MSADRGKGGYHKVANGDALKTVQEHSQPQHLVLYDEHSLLSPAISKELNGPYRVWVMLEYKKIPYQYIEVDPYEKPKSLLDINPRGLVPALKIGTNGDCLGESTVIMEYLEELFCPPNVPAMDEQRYPTTLPSLTDPYARAKARLAIDHVNRNIVPAFYRYLQAQEEEKQVKGAKEYVDALAGLVDSMDKEGPFWGGNELGMVDMTVLPWILRGRTVLRHYRSFAIPFSPDSRYKKWEDAVCSHPAVKATTSEDGLYLDSYERYAKNLPNTSKVADAINSGRGLP